MCHTTHFVITQGGNSALILAAMRGETVVVVELVMAGAKMDIQNEVCKYVYVVYNVRTYICRYTKNVFIPLNFLYNLCVFGLI